MKPGRKEAGRKFAEWGPRAERGVEQGGGGEEEGQMLLPFSAVKVEIGTKGRLIRRASASNADLSEGDCRGRLLH